MPTSSGPTKQRISAFIKSAHSFRICTEQYFHHSLMKPAFAIKAINQAQIKHRLPHILKWKEFGLTQFIYIKKEA